MSALVPELAVTDIARSLCFYRGVLGFAVAYERPEEGFARIALGAAELMLDEIGGAARSGWTGRCSTRRWGAA